MYQLLAADKPIKDFSKFPLLIGKYMEIRLINPIDGLNIYEGVLKEVNNEEITLSYRVKTRTKEVIIKISNIKQSKINCKSIKERIMLNAKLFFEAIDALEQQGINREITIQALKDAFETIVKKKHIDGLPDLMVKVDIDVENGKINIYNIKNVVEDVQDDALEISLEDAQETNPDIKIGDQVFIEVKLEEFTKADSN